MAIGIKVAKAGPGSDPGASKFFGTPTVPLAWETDFAEDEIFFCQLRLEELAHLDTENRLPHTGYLYVFLHTQTLTADVRYSAKELELAFEDFNLAVPGYEMYGDAWQMEFYPAPEDADCTRLLGIPSDWSYPASPPALLMQYDPLDSEMGFLDTMDGFLYLFFGQDSTDLTAVTLRAEYS